METPQSKPPEICFLLHPDLVFLLAISLSHRVVQLESYNVDTLRILLRVWILAIM